MAKENGGDIGAVHQAVQSLAGEMRSGFTELRTGQQKLEAGQQKLEAGQQKLEAGLEDVRQTLTHYHSAVLGHGILITELETRVRRLEQHVGLPPQG